ncbi:AzlC family ABC transporter permease [Nocardiopsis rhodophaea]|uniref:AzlC family ABC transporter permease n=1 Tax=Nocardiopsis rhodophaea TaxID=280238 RepID=UPI0031D3D7FD
MISVVEEADTSRWPGRTVVRDASALALAVAAYGVSYGTLATSSGLAIWQTQALSLLMYSGASQFGLVGVLSAGGSGGTAGVTAVLLGSRNLFYSFGLAPSLRGAGRRWLLPAAHLVSDESAAMAMAQAPGAHRRFAFWTTGLLVFGSWNLGTLLGSVAGSLLVDPEALGLDVAAATAFLALLWPRMREAGNAVIALASAVCTVVLIPVLPSGLPVVVTALIVLTVAGLLPRRLPGTLQQESAPPTKEQEHSR